MKRCAIILLVLGGIILLSGGCASSPIANASVQSDETIALAELGPAIEPATPCTPFSFHLGTGDALGQAVFMNYATLVRANPHWHFADAADSSEKMYEVHFSEARSAK